MPILMVALLALSVFGVIGLLLLIAVILEHKKIKTEANDLHLAGPKA
jgi:hypothetical protein